MTATAKLFMNGRSQAVRLPAEFRFEGSEVLVERQGDAVVLRPVHSTMAPALDAFFSTLEAVPDDFLDDRDNEPPQQRDCL